MSTPQSLPPARQEYNQPVRPAIPGPGGALEPGTSPGSSEGDGPRSREMRAFSVRRNIASRQRPTLPRTCARSTIGAEGLNCRVRNGNGCFPLATATGKLRNWKERRSCGSEDPDGSWSTESGQSDRIRRLGRILVKPNDRLVQVSSMPCGTYTSCLSTW